MFGRLTWRAAIVCMTMVAAGPAPADGHESRPARVGPETVRLLDVPYVSQSAALCGGAAVSMVLRYWGEPALVAEDFSSLLEPDGDGIRTGALVAAVRARGWSAYPVSGTPTAIQDHLAHGRPVIALVAAGAGAFHYVVLLAWANDGVILHDPAVAPFRTQSAASFDAAWAASGRWALRDPPRRTAPARRRRRTRRTSARPRPSVLRRATPSWPTRSGSRAPAMPPPPRASSSPPRRGVRNRPRPCAAAPGCASPPRTGPARPGWPSARWRSIPRTPTRGGSWPGAGSCSTTTWARCARGTRWRNRASISRASTASIASATAPSPSNSTCRRDRC